MNYRAPYKPTFIDGAKPRNGSTVFRGITQPEHDSVVRTQHVRSDESQSIKGEGTCFGDDWATADSYVNAGSSDPTKTGQNSYVLEVQHGPEIGMDKADGYWKTPTPIHESRIKRAWQFTPQGTIAEGVWHSGKGFQATTPHAPHYRWSGQSWPDYDQTLSGPGAAPPGPGKTIQEQALDRQNKLRASYGMAPHVPLAKAFLDSPIGTEIGEGKWDYSHMLTPQHRAAGYSLHLEHDNENYAAPAVLAYLNHKDETVGTAVSFIGEHRRSLVDPRQTHRSFEIDDVDLEDAHQGKGLGPSTYKALMVHSKNLFGCTHVTGGEHSTMAHRVHQKLAAEEGLPYCARPNIGGKRSPYPNQEAWSTSKNEPYDRKYGPYEYPLKPMRKAQVDSDFKHIVGALDTNASSVVDHGPHLEAHPPEMDPQVGFYQQTFLNSPSVVRKVKSPKLGGVSKKVVFDSGHGDTFMVKPYHERVTKSAASWMHRPIQGWAEMTNQSLYHAAGLGHMHQKVHVSEHDMGPGHENEPALVVHMEPHTKEAIDMQPADYHESMLHDAAKIGAMDFLTHNMDRHSHNLLVRHPDHFNPEAHGSRLMAIDHGRSFQYKYSTKNPKFEAAAGGNPLDDNLANYLQSGAMATLSRFSSADGGPKVSNPAHFIPVLKQWWPKARDSVVATMHYHLKSVKDQASRSHMWKNFMERVGKLDDITRHSDEFMDGDREMLSVPIYTPREATTGYNPFQKDF